MTIIREQTRITGSKRLGDVTATTVEDISVAADVISLDRDAVRDSLREEFSEELDELRDDARKDGLLAAEAEMKAYRKLLEDEQRKWQENERDRAAERADAQAATVAAVVAAFQSSLVAINDSLQASVLAVAYAAVTRMLGELAADAVLVERLVAQAVREHALSSPYTLALAPADHARLSAIVDTSGMQCAVDDNLKEGDCIIRFEGGRIDAGLEQQLTVLKHVFLESLAVTHADA